jgi:hypothetical protein
MPNENASAKLREASASLESVRGTFFEVGREVVESGGESGWRIAKELLALAETVDSVRARVASMIETGGAKHEKHEDVVLERGEGAITSHASSRKRKSEYPKFLVREDTLVKVGLGRDRRSEYEHTVSKAEFDSIVSGIAELLKAHRSFSADALQNTLACPAYRTYIVLALLRKVGVLDSRQRGKYTARSAESLQSDAGKAWTETAVS